MTRDEAHEAVRKVFSKAGTGRYPTANAWVDLLMRTSNDAPAIDTLEEARKDLRAKAQKGTTCTLCTQNVKIYRRGLGSNMAVVLCLALRHFGQKWFSVPDDLAPLLEDPYRNVLNGGDYAKLEWWELIEPASDLREDGSPRTGWFRVTAEGEAFARGLSEVPSHSISYNKALIRLDDTAMIKIDGALRKRFDYTELMET